jgi:hypothetical protein
MAETNLTLLEGVVLDMLAEGKTPRQIGEAVGISPAEAAQMAYRLLDKEIVTDPESRRKLQVYRLEKIVNALWERTMRNADRDDVKNLVLVLEQLNNLLALNKEQDAEMLVRMQQHQLASYLMSLKALLTAFQTLAPNLMTAEEWANFTAIQLTTAQERLQYELEE